MSHICHIICCVLLFPLYSMLYNNVTGYYEETMLSYVIGLVSTIIQKVMLYSMLYDRTL